jgi:hypothetical protein
VLRFSFSVGLHAGLALRPPRVALLVLGGVARRLGPPHVTLLLVSGVAGRLGLLSHVGDDLWP